MSVHLPTKAQFDALLPTLEDYARAWAERECSSLDAAVFSEPLKEPDEGSIWDVPAIDSKRAVSLLAELEPLIGGDCKLPVSVIKSGGYTSADDLVTRLFAALREKCPEGRKARITTPPTAPQARS